MLKLQLDQSAVLEAIKNVAGSYGIPLEGKQVLARVLVVKGEVTGAEIGIANEGEDTSSFTPVKKEPTKRGPRKAKADKAAQA